MQLNTVYENLTYITADGDEIILSQPGNNKWWETIGRSGFKAPEVQAESRTYANGATRTLAVILKPRTVTLEMVVRGVTRLEAVNIYNDLVSRLVQIGPRDDWGRLNIRKADGTYIYLNCVYTGGLNITEQYPRIFQFTLEFEAGDPYFYDTTETVVESSELNSPIYLKSGLRLGAWTLKGGLTSIDIENSGETLYPVIDVYGPASVIRLRNQATGKILAMDPSFSLLGGQVLTLDCRENLRRIGLTDANGITTDISHSLALGSSLIWPVQKGTNRISLYYTGSGRTSGYRIRYQRRYYSA